MLRLSLVVVLLCPGVSSSLMGWVESPGYPKGYPSHQSIPWSRCAPAGHTLSIQLTHFDLEDSIDCENDALKVFSNGNLIQVLCGKRDFEELQSTINPQLWSSPGGCLNLTFHSDFSNNKRHSGFRGFYTIQDYNECKDDPDNRCTQFCHNFVGGYYCSCRLGYYLDADNHTCTVSCSQDLSGKTRGDISSPSWPGSYPESSHCVFTLSVPPHLQLELSFAQAFDIEQGTDKQCIDSLTGPDKQCIDSLTIETLSGSQGPFCGSTLPPSPLLTHSHQVKIHFVTDGFGTNTGFSLNFKTRDKVCLPGSPHSSMTPNKEEYHSGDEVTVTCETGYFAYDNKRKVVKKYGSTCQSTGNWEPKYPCQPVNCGRPKIPKDGNLVLDGSDPPLYKSQIKFNCSSKYYTLQGADTYTCGPSGKWISSDKSTELPKCIEVCGMPEISSVRLSRIFGGKMAMLGEMPWQLLIKSPRRGGASLINDRWAVTAAHVVDGYEQSNMEWFGGVVNGTKARRGSNDVTMLVSERTIIHPNYRKGVSSDVRTNFDHDIALIRFQSKVSLGPNVMPICLPESNQVLADGQMGTVAGFGVTERNKISMMLRHAAVGIYSEQKCRDTPVLPPNRRMTYTDNMFCAGDSQKEKDSCEQDSGGPLFFPVLGGSTPYRLAGIVSWGPPCNQKGFRGYYTKVKNYVQWIQDTIQSTENSINQE